MIWRMNRAMNRATRKTSNPKDPKQINLMATWKRTKSLDNGWIRLERPVHRHEPKDLKIYLAQGIEKANAKETAHWKTTPEIKTEFFDNYETHLWEYKTLEFNRVHRDILYTMEKRLTDGVDIHHVIKRAVAKHKPEFEDLFQELDEDSDKDP